MNVSPVQDLTCARLERSWRDLFKPPSNQPVDEWIEDNLILAGASQSQGHIDLNRTPYCREVLNCLLDDSVRWVTLCWASQISKSTNLIGMGCYSCCENSVPVILGTATDDLAQYFVEEKLNPILNASPGINSKLKSGRDDDTIFHKRFLNSTWEILGGGSVRSGISRSCGLLLLDEIEHMASGVYANFVQRVKGYQRAKIIEAGTPVLEDGILWRRFLKGSQSYWYVKMPCCDTVQKLVFDQLKWSKDAKVDDEWDADEVEATAYYECPRCKAWIEDCDKRELLLSGHWQAENPKSKRHRSYHLNSLYSPFLTFGECARAFIESDHHREKVKDFRGGWLARPWTLPATEATTNRILARCGKYDRGKMPCIPSAVLLAADYGKKRIHWVVAAIEAPTDKGRARDATRILDEGSVENLEQLAEVGERLYDGYAITHKGLDCGYNTPEVKDFCRNNRWWPIFGSTKITSGYAFNKNDGHLTVHTDIMKDLLDDKINDPRNKWNLFKNDGMLGEFVAHMAGETRVLKEDGYGVAKRRWRRIGANHLLDCCVYIECMSLAFGCRFGNKLLPIKPPDEHKQEEKPKVVERLPMSPADRLDKYSRFSKWSVQIL